MSCGSGRGNRSSLLWRLRIGDRDGVILPSHVVIVNLWVAHVLQSTPDLGAGGKAPPQSGSLPALLS